jgi:hypothetical protein
MMSTSNILDSGLSDREKWQKLEQKTRMYCSGMKDYRLRDKLFIAASFMNELDIKGIMREQVEYMIKYDFRDFKNLSCNSSQEQIIALMIFYVMKKHNIGLIPEEFNLFKELKLSNKHYMTFTTKLCQHYQQKTLI